MYQKMLNGLQDFFGISRKEARGALVMMMFCVLVIGSPFAFRRFILPLVPGSPAPGGQAPERRVLDSIAALLEQQQALQYSSRRPPRTPSGLPPTPQRIHPVDFDPNTASEAMLAGVGIPPFLAARMVKFRSKGGQFRRKEDLKKIYDFPADLYARLEAHIVIPNPPGIANAAGPPASGAANATPRNTAARQAPVQDVRRAFDINQCDTTALIRLKGIGSKLAQRILKFRDGLGGFHSPDQYAEVYGLDSLALDELRRYAKVSSAVKKIDINAATAEELARHPYLRNRKQMQVLILYRTQHGPFRSLEELRNVKVIDEPTIQKAGPYLSF